MQFDRLNGDDLLSAVNAYTKGYDAGWKNNVKNLRGTRCYTKLDPEISEILEIVDDEKGKIIDFKA